MPIISDRRRALRLVAALPGLALAGTLGAGAALAIAPPPRRWQGVALGARASLTIYHPDRSKADEILAQALSEIERLERVFSLYRADSALSRLNAEGRLEAPPMELVELLGRARLWSEATGGAFDPTIQPLWLLYRNHFATKNADPAGPDAASLAGACRLVDHRAMTIEPRQIFLHEPGMAITLNGIAQGYITDRVAELLRAEGLTQVMIDLGEVRGLGRHPDGRPWRVGIPDPWAPGRLHETLEIADRAVATSATTAFHFDAERRHHHLFDPRTGRPSSALLAATVVADRACDADACSTAILSSGEDLTPALVGRRFGIKEFMTFDREGNRRSSRVVATRS